MPQNIFNTKPIRKTYTAKMTWINDADSFKVFVPALNQGRKIWKLRVGGIDAPEFNRQNIQTDNPQLISHFRWGELAKEATKQLIENQELTITVIDTDHRYGRKVAEVNVVGQDLAHYLISQGLAQVTQQFVSLCSNQYELEQAEKSAIAHKLGFWNDPHYIAPEMARNILKNLLN